MKFTFRIVAMSLLVVMMAPMALGLVQFNDGVRYQIGANRATSSSSPSDTYVAADGTILAAYSNGATACYVARSDDGGLTWTETSIGGGTYCLMVKKSETEYVAFNGVAGFYRTTDTGQTWALYATLVDGCVGTPSRHWSFEVNRADPNKMLIVWGGGSTGTDDLCAAYSLDGGATWSATVIVLNTGSGSMYQSSLIHVSGDIWVAFFQAQSSCPYFRTTDNGATWNAGAQYPLCGTQNAVSKRGGYGGCVCVFTATDSSATDRINYLSSSDAGVTFTATQLLSAPGAEFGLSVGTVPAYYNATSGVLYAGFAVTGTTHFPNAASQQFYILNPADEFIAHTYPTVIDNMAFGQYGGEFYAVGKQTSGTSNMYFFPAQALLTPTAPATLRVEVVASGQYELTWPVSSNDPDQIQGDFNYRIYIDGVDVGLDATTAQDGDGVRYALVAATATQLSFKIRAENAAQNLNSVFTCTVSVDGSDVGAIDTCGTGGVGGVGGGGVSGPAQNPGNPLGDMIAFLEDGWGFDWSWIIGAIIMGLVVIPIAILTKGQPMVVGAFILVVDIANVQLGLWAEWTILVMIFLVIAMAGNRMFNKRDGEDSA